MQPRNVAETVGHTLATLGVSDVFGVIGSGNLVATNALVAGGARFFAARHEGGAICMADGFARASGKVGVCSVHQGPGLTNAVTGLAEAAKAATPVLVLAGDSPAADVHSNFRIGQHALVEAVGAVAERVHGPATAAADAARALRRAEVLRRPVVLMLAIDTQTIPAISPSPPSTPPLPAPAAPSPDMVAAAADLITAARRPLIIAGRGAVVADAGGALEGLGQTAGALLATSAMANGLFSGLPYSLGISGGFASPLATQLIAESDLVIAFGAGLNHWTTRHGALIAPDARLVQVDSDAAAIGAHTTPDLAIVGDAKLTATALSSELAVRGHHAQGLRTPEIANRIEARRWRHEPFDDEGTDEYVDPRALTIALDRLLPADRAVAVDSGHFLGYPAMYLDVPNARSFVFPNGFQAVGLGLGNAIGAAVAEPARITVAALGDGGLMMALPEIETAVRLSLKLLIVVYDDAAYGAEVHHFGPDGHDLSLVRFPDADLAAMARGAGAYGVTVRAVSDLEQIETWVAEPDGPLLIDAKVNPTVCAQWLEDAFKAG